MLHYTIRMEVYKMINNQFSKKVYEVLQYSIEEAVRLQNSEYGPEHFMLGIIRHGDNRAVQLLESFYVDTEMLKAEIEQKLRNEHQISESTRGTTLHELYPNIDAENVMKDCLLQANALGASSVEVEHLLLALLRDSHGYIAKLLTSNGVTYPKLYDKLSQSQNVEDYYEYGDDDEYDDSESSMDSGRQSTNVSGSSKQESRSDTPALDKYGTDITLAAANGKLDPVVGREKEIERMAQILSRRKKNNPILIGYPGVGKSAVVEGLALRIIEKKVPLFLYDKRIISLDLTALVAGTKYRGQFEERIRTIMDELKKHREIILFVDEIHTMVGAGSAAGSMDAANILKPALARGEIQCIGATTLDDYRQHIEKDGALERRFQKVLVDPTTPDETMQILHNIKDRYEEHHNVLYTDEALEACVKLTDRYISDRYFPDKAIDALDEAGARTHMMNVRSSKEIELQEKLIEEARNNKADAVKQQNFELAAGYRDQENKLTAELNRMKKEWEEELKSQKETVGETEMANVISMMSGIPVQRIAQEEHLKLKDMKAHLLSRVIGQDKAVETLVKSIQRSRVGLKDPNRPIGTFLFLGPTGVGKTHLAKQLALEMFDSKDAIIRVDMSEFMEKFAVSRLIGAPPGYVGYDQGGQLTESVRRKPYSIVLLDEIEKAHPDVFNLLLQVMDEGRLTDSNGKTVDFKNTIIILTSNVGTRQLKEFGKGIGFSAQLRTDDKEYSRSVITKALNKSFAPEFINRLDEIITFDQLDETSLAKIVDIELNTLYPRIQQIGFNLKIDDEAKKYVAQKGYDVQFGARPLKRSIQTYIEDEIASMIINQAPPAGATIHVTFDSENNKLNYIVESSDHPTVTHTDNVEIL